MCARASVSTPPHHHLSILATLSLSLSLLLQMKSDLFLSGFLAVALFLAFPGTGGSAGTATAAGAGAATGLLGACDHCARFVPLLLEATAHRVTSAGVHAGEAGAVCASLPGEYRASCGVVDRAYGLANVDLLVATAPDVVCAAVQQCEAHAARLGLFDAAPEEEQEKGAEAARGDVLVSAGGAEAGAEAGAVAGEASLATASDPLGQLKKMIQQRQIMQQQTQQQQLMQMNLIRCVGRGYLLLCFYVFVWLAMSDFIIHPSSAVWVLLFLFFVFFFCLYYFRRFGIWRAMRRRSFFFFVPFLCLGIL
jgi:hypothetical protein